MTRERVDMGNDEREAVTHEVIESDRLSLVGRILDHGPGLPSDHLN